MDLRIIISIFLLLGSFIAGVLGMVPSWQAINESIASKRNVEKTVRDLEMYFASFDTLKKDIKNNITLETCNRLNNIAPNGNDLPQLMLQFNSLALAHNAQLLGLSVREPIAISENPGALKKSVLNAVIPVSLDNSMAFLDSIYHIERLVDVGSVKITALANTNTSDTPTAAINNLDAVIYSAGRPLDCASLTK